MSVSSVERNSSPEMCQINRKSRSDVLKSTISKVVYIELDIHLLKKKMNRQLNSKVKVYKNVLYFITHQNKFFGYNIFTVYLRL